MTSIQHLPGTEAVRAISAQLFFNSGQTGQENTGPAELKGMQRTIRAYKLPSSATADDRLLLMGALTLCGQSVNGDIPNWQCFVLTYTALAFPETIATIVTDSEGEITFEDFPTLVMDEIRSSEEKFDKDSSISISIDFPAPLPPAKKPFTVDVFNCSTLLGCYAYYSLIVHLMGKKIGPDTRENITIRRPGNLIDAFHAQSEEYILRGDGRMSDNAHTMINSSWDMLTSVKQSLVPLFAGLEKSKSPPGQIVFTLFTLLKNSGMQPAALAHQLISSFPWVIEIPILRPEYDYYVKSLLDYSKISPLVRPYIKLMYGNTTRIFHAKSLSNITACAVMYLTTVNPTLKGYTAPGGENAKAAFMHALKVRGVSLQSSSTSGATDNITETV